MSSGAPITLRRIIAQARELRPIVAQKRSHPLGLGLAKDHEIRLAGTSPARLPGFAAGLQHLEAVVIGATSGADDVGEDSAAAAWGALLGKPALAVALRPPTAEALLAQGIVVPA